MKNKIILYYFLELYNIVIDNMCNKYILIIFSPYTDLQQQPNDI